MLEKTYDPTAVEGRIFETWTQAGAFAAGAGAAPGAETFSIVIPPPNVTGSLHIGHALNNTIQDILVRYNRMLKKDVLWQPGMDHAGIATQMVVERQLAQRQQPGRREMGREQFVERVWEWKSESGGAIINQLKRLGASADFARERFTMGTHGDADDQMVRAVTKVFVELYRRGLIYRAKRLVNWHPELETAISDLEVENVEIKGHMWHLRYPLADGVTYQFPTSFDEEGRPSANETRDYLVVATTRPETMLGDTAVAVHPDDERYASLVGKFVELPLVGRRIPIIADSYADPALGSGAVKITPAHDFNDFEVGVRHKLEPINIFTPTATINDNAPPAYRGMDRFEARKAIVAELEGLGEANPARGLSHIENKPIMVPHDEKSKLVVIEPYLTDQWFADAEKLAQPAIAAVKDGKTKFVPQQYENLFFSWMDNIKPWCVSRQLWWGHRIPAWFGPDGQAFVAETEDEAHTQAEAHYGAPVELRRDDDVLDTWFSSALWPFSTLGWPDETPELKRYYQTDVLVTGFDIIFFWVARMMMMGLEFLKEEPFHTVYMHALVRDEKGQKMSKTKGNVIDPLDLIEQYGADATRFTLAAMAAQGRDIRLAISRVEGYRNFVTKLWNASRFLEMNGCVRVAGYDPRSVKLPLNRWILGATTRATAAVTRGIEEFKFNEAANAAYDFVWGTFCDWYVEFSKPVLTGADEEARDETRATAAFVLDQILKLLHPMMPFVTEELWRATGTVGPKRESLLILSDWPRLEGLEDAEADAEMDWLRQLISSVRSVKTDLNVPGGAKLPLLVVSPSKETTRRLVATSTLISRLARVEDLSLVSELPAGAARFVVGDAIWALPLEGIIDISVEVARLKKENGKLDADIAQIDKKLANKQFVAKAPSEVIEEQRERRTAAIARREKIAQALEGLL